jgi:hypothetical protein
MRLMALVAVSLAGCGGLLAPTQDDLSSWHGHFAWWTGGVLADTISAISAGGDVEVLAWGPEGWVAR